MPSPHERHARTGDYWDTRPSRHDELAAALADEQAAEPGPAKRLPGRKNTRAWCKGKEGRPHVPVIVPRPLTRRDACEWTPGWDRDRRVWESAAWSCCHVEQCGECKKILRERWELDLAECPAYPGSPEQKAAAVAEGQRRNERHGKPPRWSAREAARQRQKGVSGYRKPKASK